MIEKKMMLGDKSKNLSKMLVVKLRGCVEHQDIVKKDYETFAQKWSKNVIHGCLKCSKGVA